MRLPQASPVIVSADRGHLATALRALCVNSLEALRLGGRIEVSVQASADAGDDPDGAKWAEIAVADTGPGISPEVRRHLFDPYFSGREAGRGIGLGLSKCWRIVTEHGGRIDVESQPQQGATFRIRLPAP
jgi:signal transduction histidine kinase